MISEKLKQAQESLDRQECREVSVAEKLRETIRERNEQINKLNDLVEMREKQLEHLLSKVQAESLKSPSLGKRQDTHRDESTQAAQVGVVDSSTSTQVSAKADSPEPSRNVTKNNKRDAKAESKLKPKGESKIKKYSKHKHQPPP